MRISKDPDVRKAELIEAAETLFRQEGYMQTSVNDIVRKVGVAQGTFYYYFDSKDDIMNAVIEHYSDSFRVALALLIQDRNLDPCQKLELVGNASLWMHRFDRKLVEFLHSKENLSTHERYIVKTMEFTIPLVTAIVEQGIACGMFSLKHPRDTVELLLYAFGYLEDTIAFMPEDVAYMQKLEACSLLICRALGIPEGRINLNPSSVDGVVRQLLKIDEA